MNTHVSTILANTREVVSRYDFLLARLGFFQGVDEVALYLEDRHDLAEAVGMMKKEGLEHFNSAVDHVHTRPLRTCYDVQYEFIKVPRITGDRDGYRLECMAIAGGLSPLHAAVHEKCRLAGVNGCAVHASFKVETEADYAEAVDRLRRTGWEMAQGCESDYGRFSYWQPLVPAEWPGFTPGVYLKPRVNLRDGS